MTIITKVIALVMFPLGILIILGHANLLNISIGIDKVFLGAILMIAMQIVSLIFQKIVNGNFSIMSLITSVIFLGTAAAALLSSYLPSPIQSVLPLILGVMMIVEGLYGFH